MKITAIITCAGKGTRAGLGINKMLYPIDGVPLALKTISVFGKNPLIDEIVITSSREDLEFFEKISRTIEKKAVVVLGGDTRGQSVYNALRVASGEIVLIHDGARPNISDEIIENCIFSVKKHGSGICCVPLTDTLAYSPDGNHVLNTYREGYLKIQTPQGFYTEQILSAYEKAITENKVYTDDSAVFLASGRTPTVCQGSQSNEKLTYPEDFKLDLVVGTGFDLHKLVEGRKLILGGVEIDYPKGLLGHSDADVVTHAVMDAMLSALNLGDIGKHFSDKDPAYKDISSIILLKKVLEMIKNEGYKVNNVAIVIMAEKPKLAHLTDKISTFLAEVIHIEPKRVGITCTTTEKVGPIGEEQAIACQCYCSLVKI